MKVVFPCKGSLVLLKQDVDTLQAYYNTRLMTSKLYEMYRSSKMMIQLDTFNYIPQTSKVVLYKSNLLTIDKMRQILGLYNQEITERAPVLPPQPKPAPTATQPSREELSNKPISDKDIMSNPFFQTFKALK